RDPERRPLVAWAGFVPAFLTLARGKLATYALSALPPLALVTGPELARMVSEGPRPDESLTVRVTGWALVAVLAAAAVAVPFALFRFPFSWLGTAVVMLAAGGWAVALARLLLQNRLARVPMFVLGAA